MKKHNLFGLVFCLLTSIAISQTKTISLSKVKIGTLDCRYVKEKNLEYGDSTYTIDISFKNMKYKSIVDWKTIVLFDSEWQNEFKTKLISAASQMNQNQTIKWDEGGYSFWLTEGVKGLVIGQYSGDEFAYTLINKIDADKLVNWLTSIDFGKDKLIKTSIQKK
jgi:hypothetical protein